MKLCLRSVVCFLVGAACLPACGGNSEQGEAESPLACEPFVACGGDVEGTWAVKTVCPSSAAEKLLETPPASCPSASVTLDKIEVTGTATLDGVQFQQAIRGDVAITMKVPASCLPAGFSCQRLQESTQAEVQASSSIACRPDAGGCACAQTSTFTSSESPAYSIEGTTLRAVDDAGAPEDGEFCVSGSVFKLKTADSIIVYSRL